MFCSNCGTKAVQGNFFCTTCGQALDPASAVEPAAIPALEEPSKPAEQSVAEEAGRSAPPVHKTIPVAVGDVPDGTPESPDPPFSVFTSPKEATVKKTDAGTRHARRRLAIYAGLFALAALAVVGVLGVVSSTTASGIPPADPAQALHRLKDVAKIDLPIDAAAVDTGRSLVPADMPQEPSAVGEYIGAVSMASGDTVELRVSAYTLAADAAQYALWWNTSGVKEYFAESSAVSVAVQCGRIVIDGAWVARHTQDDTIEMLHQAYPDCSPYIPEKAAPAPESYTELPPPMEEKPLPVPTPTQITPPPADGYFYVVGEGDPVLVPGAFAITNFVVTDKGQDNFSVSFTAKNTTRQVLTLGPVVSLTDASGLSASFDGRGVCHSLRPNTSERITIGQSEDRGLVPTNATEALVESLFCSLW